LRIKLQGKLPLKAILWSDRGQQSAATAAAEAVTAAATTGGAEAKSRRKGRGGTRIKSKID